MAGENIFKVFDDVVVLAESVQGTFEQVEAVLMQVGLRHEFLVQLVQVLQVLLLRRGFHRNCSVGFLKVLEVRIKEAEASDEVEDDLEGSVR